MDIITEYRRQKKDKPNIVICIYTYYSFYIYDKSKLQNLLTKESFSVSDGNAVSKATELIRESSDNSSIIIILTPINHALDLFLDFREKINSGNFLYGKKDIFKSWVEYFI